jgi:hypothetical protein
MIIHALLVTVRMMNDNSDERQRVGTVVLRARKYTEVAVTWFTGTVVTAYILRVRGLVCTEARGGSPPSLPRI